MEKQIYDDIYQKDLLFANIWTYFDYMLPLFWIFKFFWFLFLKSL